MKSIECGDGEHKVCEFPRCTCRCHDDSFDEYDDDYDDYPISRHRDNDDIDEILGMVAGDFGAGTHLFF